MTDNLLNPWESQRAAMGAFIRHQRELANMSLRQLSQATQVSNAYLSQIERGLHDPTLRVLIQIGAALQLSIEDMLREGVHQSGEATRRPRRPRRRGGCSTRRPTARSGRKRGPDCGLSAASSSRIRRLSRWPTPLGHDL